MTCRAFALFFAASAATLSAATYTYSNGENNTNPIEITSDSTFTIASGSATQSGRVTINPNTLDITRDGAGTLTFADWLSLDFVNLTNGTTILTGTNGSHFNYLNIDYGENGAPVLRVSGASLNAYTIYAGNYVAGSIEVTNGGTIRNQNSAVLGYGTGTGSLLISGANSVFTSQTWDLVAGRGGAGHITLSAGGRMTATNSSRTIVFGEQSTGRGYLNIGSASGQAASAPGIYNLYQAVGGSGGGEVVFNHTSDDYYFTQDGRATGGVIWVRGNMSFRVESGVTTLRDINNNTGNTLVMGGTLLISKVTGNESVLGTGTVTVGANGTLGGSGLVKGPASVSGTLDPGTDAGTGLMTFQNGLSLEGGSTVVMEIGGYTRGSEYDAIDVHGMLLILNGSDLRINFIDGFAPDDGSTFSLFGGAHSSNGNFAGIFCPPGWQGTFNPSNGVLTLTAIPEPSSVGLVMSGAFAIVVYRRSRKARS